MRIIYWHDSRQPYLKLVAIESSPGTYKCEMPYLEEVRGYEEIRTMTHSMGQETFDRSFASGLWVLDGIEEFGE